MLVKAALTVSNFGSPPCPGLFVVLKTASRVGGGVLLPSNSVPLLLGPQYCFFGQATDVSLAHWLLETCINCAEVEWSKARRNGTMTAPDGRRYVIETNARGRKHFMLGMCSRIVERLDAMTVARDPAINASPTGRDVLVVKDQIVGERFDGYCAQFGLKLEYSKGGRKRRVGNGYYAGQAAGPPMRRQGR
jgi:hypothetical protein